MNSIDPPLLGLSQRHPPSNERAEMALLGALLANNKAYERISEFLSPEHFSDPVHGRIYQAIVRRVEAGQLADAVTLKAEFEHSGLLDEVGGTAYFAQLLTAMVGIINAGEYGRAVHDAWLRRQLIDIGEVVVNNAFGAEAELDGKQQIELAESELFKLATVNGHDGGFVTFERALIDAGIPLRHVAQGRNVAMYRTNVPTAPAGSFHGPLVVSMRPVAAADVGRAADVTGRFPDMHGRPVHHGDPAALGIADLDRPDYGDAVKLLPGETPVFWACGVTSQAALEAAGIPFFIAHAPGCMLITDLRHPAR